MAYYKESSYYMFCIDTNDYAGNFERQMAWYVTGIKPESLGGRYADIGTITAISPDLEDLDISLFKYLQLEHGETYVSICQSPVPHLHCFNSVVIFMHRKPTKNEIDLFKRRARHFVSLQEQKSFGPPMMPTGSKTLGFRLLKHDVKVSKVKI